MYECIFDTEAYYAVEIPKKRLHELQLFVKPVFGVCMKPFKDPRFQQPQQIKASPSISPFIPLFMICNRHTPHFAPQPPAISQDRRAILQHFTSTNCSAANQSQPPFNRHCRKCSGIRSETPRPLTRTAQWLPELCRG